MEFMELIHVKINRVLVGPNMCDFIINWLIAMLDWLASLYDMHAIIMYLCTNLVSYDSTQLAAKVCDSCPIGVSADLCSAGAPLSGWVIWVIYFVFITMH